MKTPLKQSQHCNIQLSDEEYSNKYSNYIHNKLTSSAELLKELSAVALVYKRKALHIFILKS